MIGFWIMLAWLSYHFGLGPGAWLILLCFLLSLAVLTLWQAEASRLRKRILLLEEELAKSDRKRPEGQEV